MNLTAKLIQLLPLQTGSGKNGEWKRQDIILETDGQYPKKICIAVWGDKINLQQFALGQVLKVDFDIESREYNGRWYTDLKAWRIEPISTSPQSPIIDQIKADNLDAPFDENEPLPF